MRFLRFLAIAGGFTALLYSQTTTTVSGFWNGGAQEVYSNGNESYCLKPTASSSADLTLNTGGGNNINSCIYLTYGTVKASQCGKNPTLSVTGLNSKLYKIVLAPETAQSNTAYTLSVTYDGTFDRCPDYYQAGYLGMSKENINFLLGLAGFLTAFLLVGSLTYILVTLGNF